MEWFGLEGTLKNHLVQCLCRGQGHLSPIRLLKALSSLTLNTSKDWTSTTSPDNLFQCLTTLIIKNFFLMSRLNLPSFSLKPLPLVLSLQALVKCLVMQCLEIPFKYWKVARKSLRSSLLWTEQHQLSQPLFIGEMFQPSDNFHGLPLDLL